ncbi:MAG: flippase-like domain-containing protein [Proteobacteria bacterium]|nr:flippase-like domain-containing protein [Pseudomonadota bacterium]
MLRPQSARQLLIIPASIAVVGVLIWWLNPVSLVKSAKALSCFHVGGVLGLLGIMQALRAWRFRISLYRGGSPSLLKLSAVVCIHEFLNHILPARTGELSYPYLLHRYCSRSVHQGTASLILIRIHEIIVLCFLVTAALLLILKNRGTDVSLLLTMAILLVLVSVLSWRLLPGLLSFVRLGFKRFLRRKTSGDFSARWIIRLTEFFEQLSTELEKPRGILHHLGLSTLTVIIWLALFALFWLVLDGVGLHMSYADAVAGSCLANLTQLLPINTLGSVGTLEIGWTLGFTWLGFDPRAALAAGFVMHGLVIIGGGLLALCSWILLEWGKRIRTGPKRLKNSEKDENLGRTGPSRSHARNG